MSGLIEPDSLSSSKKDSLTAVGKWLVRANYCSRSAAQTLPKLRGASTQTAVGE
ncbi:MAG TPA: hypothetical protein VN764_18935 [Polyangiaceae bacterium]|nr:hypothetical protein [Polyangiaceae bacterium]